jgi:hypothetical protein
LVNVFSVSAPVRCEANTVRPGTIAVQLMMKIGKIQGFDNNFF